MRGSLLYFVILNIGDMLNRECFYFSLMAFVIVWWTFVLINLITIMENNKGYQGIRDGIETVFICMKPFHLNGNLSI